MKKTIKMMLKEDFEKTYQPKLKASDVMEKTEYFNIDLKEQCAKNNKALKQYRLSFKLSAIMSIVLLFGVIGLACIHWGWDNTGREKTGTEILTDEYYDYMVSINQNVSKDYQCSIRINDKTSMYIYKGIDVKEQIADYFYIVHFEHTKNNPITILIDTRAVSISETSCGHLSTISVEKEEALYFTINANGLSKEYTIVD